MHRKLRALCLTASRESIFLLAVRQRKHLSACSALQQAAASIRTTSMQERGGGMRTQAREEERMLEAREEEGSLLYLQEHAVLSRMPRIYLRVHY